MFRSPVRNITIALAVMVVAFAGILIDGILSGGMGITDWGYHAISLVVIFLMVLARRNMVRKPAERKDDAEKK